MKYSEAIPKIPLKFLAIFYIMCFETITTNSHTSTLWKLNADRTKIIEGDPSEINDDRANPSNTVPHLFNSEDSVFKIITSTEHYGSSWVKQDEESVCSGCNVKMDHSRNTKQNSTEIDNMKEFQKQTFEDDHELSCGKPVNFTFYDNLVGVMNRENHPPSVEPEAMIEFIRKYKFKVGKTFDLGLIENKLKQTKKEKPKSVGTLQQLGNFWRIKGDPRRAIECFRKALSVSPHNAEILLNLAKVLFHLQYLDDAIYLTRRSLEVAPPERGAWQQYFTLGEIFKAYGHYQEAQIHFRHTLDLHPGYEPAIKLLKELEEMPLSPWQTYTYFIIGSLVELSFMTFEGTQIQGAPKIMEKLNSLTFQKINRIITAVDSQPMFDGGVLINVLGRLQTDEDLPHAYVQTFVLKPIEGSFFVQHDVFRLVLHDTI